MIEEKEGMKTKNKSQCKKDAKRKQQKKQIN